MYGDTIKPFCEHYKLHKNLASLSIDKYDFIDNIRYISNVPIKFLFRSRDHLSLKSYSFYLNNLDLISKISSISAIISRI